MLWLRLGWMFTLLAASTHHSAKVHSEVENDPLGHLASAELLLQLGELGRRVPCLALRYVLILKDAQPPWPQLVVRHTVVVFADDLGVERVQHKCVPTRAHKERLKINPAAVKVLQGKPSQAVPNAPSSWRCTPSGLSLIHI